MEGDCVEKGGRGLVAIDELSAYGSGEAEEDLDGRFGAEPYSASLGLGAAKTICSLQQSSSNDDGVDDRDIE